MQSSLGLIGYGSFGRFTAPFLERHFQLCVFDRVESLRAGVLADGLRWGSLEEVASCDIVVPAVPVQELHELLGEIVPSMQPGSLVVDVASVKVKPLALLAEVLPAEVDFVGLHPMFGPQSGRDGIEGLKVAQCPGRGTRGPEVRSFLEEELGLEVLEMSAEEHDSEMAYVQGLTHWMAKALREIRTPDVRLSTPAYRHLMRIEEILGDDSWELFVTIQNENPFVEAARRELVDRLMEIEQSLKGR